MRFLNKYFYTPTQMKKFVIEIKNNFNKSLIRIYVF